jgi:hypothetical protein
MPENRVSTLSRIPLRDRTRWYNSKSPMRTPIRVATLVAAALAALYCAFTMAVTWSEGSEGGFIDPWVAACFIASALIIVVAVRFKRPACSSRQTTSPGFGRRASLCFALNKSAALSRGEVSLTMMAPWRPLLLARATMISFTWTAAVPHSTPEAFTNTECRLTPSLKPMLE